jgi:hypothetical protein
VLVVSNVVRLVPVVTVAVLVAKDVSGPPLFAMILLAFSINRFFLAALSASLPHVVAPDELVLANSITPTSGTLAFMLGLGAASGLRQVLPGSDPDVTVVLIAAVGYLAAALLALRLPRMLLGPHLEDAREEVTAAYALMVIAAHRFCYGLTTVATILLYRNHFHDPSDTDAALAGLSLAILVSGVGYFVAAVVTPVATARTTPPRWIVVLLLVAAAVNVFPAGLYVEPAIVAAAFALGVASQGVKICVDTLVQAGVDDAFRGRVFALYDVVFNVVFVAAAAVGALVIPTDGKSYAVLGAIALGYAATALAYSRTDSVRSGRPVTYVTDVEPEPPDAPRSQPDVPGPGTSSARP